MRLWSRPTPHEGSNTPGEFQRLRLTHDSQRLVPFWVGCLTSKEDTFFAPWAGKRTVVTAAFIHARRTQPCREGGMEHNHMGVG